MTSKTSPAAKSRFLQIPGTPGLLQIPSSAFSVLTSPLRGILLSGVLREALRRANRPRNIKDESFDAFMTRRFGEPFARTFGSALVHGIYAADSRKLSVRAAFPSLWTAEERGRGSVVRGMLRPSAATLSEKRDYDLGGIPRLLKGASVYSFRDGMQTLTDALEHYLSKQANVRIHCNTGVTLLQLKKDRSFEVRPSLP
jgi:oxygen-dependent protoporphyrinogen oxidase